MFGSIAFGWSAPGQEPLFGPAPRVRTTVLVAGVRNLTPPITVRNLTPAIGVKNLTPAVAVKNITPTVAVIVVRD